MSINNNQGAPNKKIKVPAVIDEINHTPDAAAVKRLLKNGSINYESDTLHLMEEKMLEVSHHTSVSMGGKDRSEGYLSDNCVEVFQVPAMRWATSTQHVELRVLEEMLVHWLKV